MTPRIGPIFGVYLQLQPFWLPAYVLLSIGIVAVGVPGAPALSSTIGIVLAIVAALMLIVSYAAHEMTHAIVGRRLGLDIDEVGLFGFVDRNRPSPEPTSGRAEAWIAVSGVLVSALLAAVAFGLWSTLPVAADEGSSLLRGITWWAAVGNLALAVVNSALSYPYDGGRFVRGVLWASIGDKLQATRIASRIGRYFAMGLLVAGAIWALLTGELFYTLWLFAAGLFLLKSSRRQYRRLEIGQAVEGLKVSDVMDDNVAVVGPNLTLDTLFGQHERDDDVLTYPVTNGGVLVGSIEVGQIERVPRAQWARTRVGEVMTTLERLQTLTGGQSVMDALARFDGSTTDAIAVVDDDHGDRLVGLLTRDRLIEKLRPRVRRLSDQERALESPR